MDIAEKAKTFYKNQNLSELLLISQNGQILVFLSKENVDEAGRKRIAASVLASSALGSRTTSNLVGTEVKTIKLKGEFSTSFITQTKDKNYLYIKVEDVSDNGIKTIGKELSNFI